MRTLEALIALLMPCAIAGFGLQAHGVLGLSSMVKIPVGIPRGLAKTRPIALLQTRALYGSRHAGDMQMQLSGRQQYYLEKEAAWEREIEPARPAAVALAGAHDQCAHCSSPLGAVPVQCSICTEAYCRTSCHQDAWQLHKFSCSDKVRVQ